MNQPTHNRGFIALTSVIIISAILLVLIYLLGTAGFFSRFDALDSEDKSSSLELAEACVSSAKLDIAEASTTEIGSTGSCISLGGSCTGSDPQRVCKICSITPPSGTNYTIVTRALYNGAFTNLTVGVSDNAGVFTITSWNETPTSSAASSCSVP